MAKKATTLPVEEDGEKFDVDVTYEISTGKKITITAVEDEGKPFELTDAQKQALAAHLLDLHPDHTLPDDWPKPDQGLPAPPVEPDNTLPPVEPAAPDQGLPPVEPGAPDQSLPPVNPGEPTQPLPINPDNGLPEVPPGVATLPVPPGTPTDPVTGEPVAPDNELPETPGTKPVEPDIVCETCGQVVPKDRPPLTIAQQLAGRRY